MSTNLKCHIQKTIMFNRQKNKEESIKFKFDCFRQLGDTLSVIFWEINIIQNSIKWIVRYFLLESKFYIFYIFNLPRQKPKSIHSRGTWLKHRNAFSSETSMTCCEFVLTFTSQLFITVCLVYVSFCLRLGGWMKIDVNYVYLVF